MISIKWYPVSTKIVKHFKDNVFVPTVGPTFDDWLFEETGGEIVPGIDDMYLEFADDNDLTMFLLKWT